MKRLLRKLFPQAPKVRPWIIELPYRGEDNQWYLRMKGGNGEVVWVAEGSATKQHAEERRDSFIEQVSSGNFKVEYEEVPDA